MAGGRLVRRKLRKLRADLLEREPDALGEDDESDPTEDWPWIAAVPGPCPLGADEALLLVEAKR